MHCDSVTQKEGMRSDPSVLYVHISYYFGFWGSFFLSSDAVDLLCKVPEG